MFNVQKLESKINGLFLSTQLCNTVHTYCSQVMLLSYSDSKDMNVLFYLGLYNLSLHKRVGGCHIFQYMFENHHMYMLMVHTSMDPIHHQLYNNNHIEMLIKVCHFTSVLHNGQYVLQSFNFYIERLVLAGSLYEYELMFHVQRRLVYLMDHISMDYGSSDLHIPTAWYHSQIIKGM